MTEVMNWMRQSAEQELVTPESVDVSEWDGCDCGECEVSVVGVNAGVLW
jgi:hypothetical protein